MDLLLSVYVLMWPALVLGVLVVIAGGFARDARRARDEGRPMI
ncbi:hypothetical protein GCM10027060_22500 [Nesterenkonia halophila]|uniref:Uncharacterized protein n=1 Tax=Nesterenkonia halobia TaxID=37922 RepID=A0ABP6RC60_9MICC|nr:MULTISPECIES: putative transporter small subunit [Nesterenkonia]